MGPGAVLALLATLVGLLGLAYSIYSFKFIGASEILFLPSRVFFVLSLALIAAPFLLVVLHDRIPYLFVLLPTAVCFLLYPLLEPHGVLYGQDAIFNFQFASSFLTHSTWVAGANTTVQAVTYSFYPGSGLFNSEGSVFLGVPLTSSFPWMLPLSRLLILPPLIFVIGNRLLGPRAAVLGVFLYLGAPSITFNDMVQQEFGIQFLVLALAVITFLVYAPPADATPLRLLVLVFSSFIVLSHHLTSYVAGIWLAGLAVIPLLLWGRPMFDRLRAAVIALRYFALFLLWVLFFTAAIVLRQLSVLEKNLLLLLSSAPITTRAAAAGSSYPTYQLVWIIGSLGVVVVLAILTLREALRGKPRPYLATSLVLGTLILTISFILFATPYSFVAIRTSEYALVFGAPAAAWFLVRRFIPAVDGMVRPPDGTPSRRGHASSKWVAPAIAIALAFFVFAGGNLVPGASRDQYQPTSALAVNSPMYVTSADFQDGVWAREHLSGGGKVWGDMLVYDVYAGIGGLDMPFDTYAVFNGTSFDLNNTIRLKVGDYVVTDVYDTTLKADFYGSRPYQPNSPLSSAQLTKFDNASHFSVVFVDPVFTVYKLIVPFYHVTFTESGLPPGTPWSVTLAATTVTSTSNNISFIELNGTYPYTLTPPGGYGATTSSGNVTINGASPTVKVAFGYALVFTESGLPSGTPWSVKITGGGSLSSSTNTITFGETNGTYAYTVVAPSGYTASPSSGVVTIAGAARSVTIVFV